MDPPYALLPLWQLVRSRLEPDVQRPEVPLLPALVHVVLHLSGGQRQPGLGALLQVRLGDGPAPWSGAGAGYASICKGKKRGFGGMEDAKQVNG